jgi:hypothetical protein
VARLPTGLIDSRASVCQIWTQCTARDCCIVTPTTLRWGSSHLLVAALFLGIVTVITVGAFCGTRRSWWHPRYMGWGPWGSVGWLYLIINAGSLRVDDGARSACGLWLVCTGARPFEVSSRVSSSVVAWSSSAGISSWCISSRSCALARLVAPSEQSRYSTGVFSSSKSSWVFPTRRSRHRRV